MQKLKARFHFKLMVLITSYNYMNYIEALNSHHEFINIRQGLSTNPDSCVRKSSGKFYSIKKNKLPQISFLLSKVSIFFLIFCRPFAAFDNNQGLRTSVMKFLCKPDKKRWWGEKQGVWYRFRSDAWLAKIFSSSAITNQVYFVFAEFVCIKSSSVVWQLNRRRCMQQLMAIWECGRARFVSHLTQIMHQR